MELDVKNLDIDTSDDELGLIKLSSKELLTSEDGVSVDFTMFWLASQRLKLLSQCM